MKKEFSKSEAQKKVKEFFEKENWKPEEMKKLKRLAMKYRISLRDEKKKFCRKCLIKLNGRTRIAGNFKIIKCANCSYLNKIPIKSLRRN